VTQSPTDLAGLRASAEDLLAVVLETTVQPMFGVDHEGRIRFANPAAIAALGYASGDQLVGRRSDATIRCRHPDGPPHPAAGWPMLLPNATGETVKRDLDWFVRRDGSMFPVSYVSVPIATPDGRGAVVAFTGVEARSPILPEHDVALAAHEDAVRRIATLVAGGAASAEVFATIAKEVAHVVGRPLVAIWRYEPDATATVMGAWGEKPHPFQAGTRWPLEHASAGVPIIVDGAVWGAMSADSTVGEPLAGHVEDRLVDFAELVATSISATASRAELARLADEQAALRRVATIVARGGAPAEVFAAVAGEIGRLLAADVTTMCRYEADGTVTVVAESGDAAFPVGTRLTVDARNVGGMVLRTGKVARVDDFANADGAFGARVRAAGTRSVVGCPIVVDGKLWGVMMAASRHADPIPATIESRIRDFTELVATAISNTEARTQVRRLADEQAALRRVATLVARGVPSSEVFGAVTEEVGTLLEADLAAMVRHEADDAMEIVATWSAAGKHPEVERHVRMEPGDLATRILATGRPVRMDGRGDVPPHRAAVREPLGIRSSVAAPIVVEGRVWGGLVVHSRQAEPLPAHTESRLENFTELVATAVANAETRAALGASRSRIVAAADESRRRIERDLHDGTQQRLVSMLLELRSAEACEEGELRAQLARSARHLSEALDELRELSRGIHPAILARGGLSRALKALARRSTVPVELELHTEQRLPEPVEVAAYFAVSEALTNAAKHADASRVKVELDVDGSILRVAIRDDGVGGADPERGSGLVGLSDRIEALGGTLQFTSPVGEGTTVLITI
jgi:PAS domain S-box-containing protein